MKSEAILLKTDGTEEKVQAHNPKKGFQLDELYQMIGNGCDMVQMVRIAHGDELWMDEEGKYREPVIPNWKATKLLAAAGGIPGDVVMGNVILFQRKRRAA